MMIGRGRSGGRGMGAVMSPSTGITRSSDRPCRTSRVSSARNSPLGCTGTYDAAGRSEPRMIRAAAAVRGASSTTLRAGGAAAGAHAASSDPSARAR